MFLPLNNHVEVKLIEQKSIVATDNDIYEEKGVVLSVAEGINTVKIGDIAYFDSWLCGKWVDSEGKTRYLVSEDSIRAVERV